MSSDDFDYIVVGGGSAGCVVAARLSEDPDVRVLLLEAGPAATTLTQRVPAAWQELQTDEQRDWQFKTTPQPTLANRPSHWPRGKMLGGCSSNNACIYVRGDPRNFDEWATTYGCDGWGYHDVLPFFKKSENASSLLALRAQADERQKKKKKKKKNADGDVRTVSDGMSGATPDFRGTDGELYVRSVRGGGDCAGGSGGGSGAIADGGGANPWTHRFVAACAQLDGSGSGGGSGRDGSAIGGGGGCDKIGAIGDYNGPSQTGAGVAQATITRDGVRHDTGTAFLTAAVRARPNLRIICDAHVTRVAMAGDTAVGVVYTTTPVLPTPMDSSSSSAAPSQPRQQHFVGVTQRRGGGEVIVCAGAVNTPWLLMVSGIGDETHLQECHVPVVAHSPGVGANLQDHLIIAHMHIIEHDTWPVNRLQRQPLAAGKALAQWMWSGAGPLSSTALEATAFVNSGLAADIQSNDLQLHFYAAVPDGDHDKLNRLTGIVDEQPPPPYGIMVLPTLLQPKSRGRITLNATNPHAYPIIEPNYLGDPDGYDLALLVRGLRLARAVCQQRAFTAGDGKRDIADAHAGKFHVGAEVDIESIDPALDRNSDAYLEAKVRHTACTVYHPTSTCVMGPVRRRDGGGGEDMRVADGDDAVRVGVDEMTVCDARLRVCGVRRLRVCDASVMPRIVSGNTNAPCIMIGEKGAAMVAEDRAARRRRMKLPSQL